MRSSSPHFSHLLRKIAQGFAPRARREEKEWLFHCDDEQRSHRCKEPARAAKRADAGVHPAIAASDESNARHKELWASARAGVRNAG